MARNFDKRLKALELAAAPARSLHAVLWGWGSSFDAALSRSGKRRNGAERVLLQLVPVKGGHGKPVENDMRPEYQAEYDKAHAWASGGCV